MIAARLVWVFPATYLPFLFPIVRKHEKPAPAAVDLVVGWAGMRGTVTLAAALSIPFVLPGRHAVSRAATSSSSWPSASSS
jgi:NhaP-type Na+/H+ or K+/H+ antiporter